MSLAVSHVVRVRKKLILGLEDPSVRSQKLKKGRRVSESESDKNEPCSWGRRKKERSHREKRKSEQSSSGKLLKKGHQK